MTHPQMLDSAENLGVTNALAYCTKVSVSRKKVFIGFTHSQV